MGRTWGVAAALAFVGAAAAAHAQSSGFWLVGLPAGGTNGTVRALSQDGTIAHGHGYGMPGFLNASYTWTLEGGRSDWGIKSGMPWNNVVTASSSSGQVIAGEIAESGMPVPHPFRRVGEGPLVDLGVLSGQTRSYAHGISGDGSIVVGHAENGANSYQYGRAWRWTQAGGMQDLGGLTQQTFLSDARAISRDGKTIVGLNINEGLAFQAFTWREGEGLKALPSLAAIPSASANAVNADGTVIVGTSVGQSGPSRAVRWVKGQPEDISGVFQGVPSQAYAVSDEGAVAGGHIGGVSLAFIWTIDEGTHYAKDYLASHGIAVPANYDLRYVYAISGDGRTFGGYARNTGTNKTEGFVAKLPGASGGCLPDCDESGKLDIDDFICFQTYFALGDPKADCDADGQLNINDFICFQTSFVLGC